MRDIEWSKWVAIGSAGLLVSMFRKPIMMFVFVILGIAALDMTYEAMTGKALIGESELEKREAKAEQARFQANWERERKQKLTKKTRAGDLIAQTDLANEYLYNDDPSDDDKGLQLLADAVKKDCAKAQNSFGVIYWRQGNKEEARTLWLYAARGREERKYGTGSYKARESIRYHFPADYDPKWDND